LHWIFEAKKRFGLSVLNYMITSTHVHMIVETPKANLSEFMRHLNISYTAAYNQQWQIRVRLACMNMLFFGA
jgi:putative transposase